MRDEMIQEAVLDSIDAIEEAQLFAEYDVVMSMANVYMKSAAIQEAAGLDFDGYVIQEAKSETATTTDDKVKYEKKEYLKYGGKSKILAWLANAINTILSGVRFIIRKLGSVFKRSKKTASKSDVQHWVCDCKYQVELSSEAQQAFNLPAKPTVQNFQVTNPAKDAYKAKDSANRKYNKSGMESGGTVEVSMDKIKIMTVIPGVDMREFVKAADWFYRACTIVDQEMEDLERQKEPANKFAKFAFKHGNAAFGVGKSSTITSYDDARKLYEDEIQMKLVEGGKKLENVKKQLKEYAKADIQDNILDHIRTTVSQITSVSNRLTKQSVEVKKFVESILTPEQHVARRERLMKEVEDEERWALDDPKAGFID